jgi:hypothetical protein
MAPAAVVFMAMISVAVEQPAPPASVQLVHTRVVVLAVDHFVPPLNNTEEDSICCNFFC